MALWLGGGAARHHRVVLLGVLLGTLGLIPGVASIRYDDDILKFLPEDSVEVQRFEAIGDRFKGLSIALLGVEVPQGDLFTAESMAALRGLTEELRKVEGVAFTSSITEVQDVAVAEDEVGEEMTVVSDLVGELPASSEAPGASEAMARLREKVLSRNHIRGALISEAGNAALVLCYLDGKVPLKDAADAIRARTEEYLATVKSSFEIHYGGSPFVGSYIVHTTRRDILRLSLLSGFAIIMLLLVTARSLVGSLIALGAVGVGILWSLGLMGLVGQPLTLVSSSLPMLLLALGSAYSIHVLVRVFKHLDCGAAPEVAVRGAVQEVGPPIFIAGLTSAFAFLSFLAMDIQPMRDFGLWMFIGTILIVFLALVLVPAACTFFPLKVREGGRTPPWALALMTGAARGVTRRPALSLAGLVVIVAASIYFSGEGKRNMTMRDFFREGSEPVEAEDFLENHLGGSVFMQIQVTGDIKDPMVLRQIDRIGAIAGAQQGVSSVQSIVEPMVLASEALHGEAKIPDAIETTRAIAALAEGDPNLRVIVDQKWEHALIHVKVHGAHTASALNLVELMAGAEGEKLRGEWARVRRSELTAALAAEELAGVKDQLEYIYRRAGLPNVDKRAVEAALTTPVPTPAPETLEALSLVELKGAILGDELIYLAPGVKLELVAARVGKLLARKGEKITTDTLYPLLYEVAAEDERADPESLRESVAYIAEMLAGHMARSAIAFREGLLAELLPEGKREHFGKVLGRAAGVLESSFAALPVRSLAGLEEGAILGRGTIEFEVTGSPVVYEGMNKSVQRNQERCLLISSVLVFLALAWFFRSGALALVASVPAAFTLLVTFGIMGYLEIPMDVGTSMMTSIAIGIGIDYAVHFLWHHGAPSAALADEVMVESMDATGWGIVINALEVAVGFGLLALGAIVPMRNVGILTACAMLVSAAATLILVPALVRWVLPIFSGRSQRV